MAARHATEALSRFDIVGECWHLEFEGEPGVMGTINGDDANEFNLHSIADWSSLYSARHNVLLEGPDAATDAVLLLVERHFGESIYWRRPSAPLELPAGEVGAVILQSVADLGAEKQGRLFRWLDDHPNPRTQIVSTTAQPLYPLVARGLFDRGLYYRLNVILLHV